MLSASQLVPLRHTRISFKRIAYCAGSIPFPFAPDLVPHASRLWYSSDTCVVDIHLKFRQKRIVVLDQGVPLYERPINLTN